jgi:hypothetical protein
MRTMGVVSRRYVQTVAGFMQCIASPSKVLYASSGDKMRRPESLDFVEILDFLSQIVITIKIPLRRPRQS